LEELHGALTGCIESFTSTFGAEAAEMTLQTSKVLVSVREQQDGKWEQSAKVVVSAIPSVPGFQIERGGDPPVVIEVGMLPGDKVFYRDREQDKYVSMEELTRRVLDRALFPKLGE